MPPPQSPPGAARRKDVTGAALRAGAGGRPAWGPHSPVPVRGAASCAGTPAARAAPRGGGGGGTAPDLPFLGAPRGASTVGGGGPGREPAGEAPRVRQSPEGGGGRRGVLCRTRA